MFDKIKIGDKVTLVKLASQHGDEEVRIDAEVIRIAAATFFVRYTPANSTTACFGEYFKSNGKSVYDIDPNYGQIEK